MGTQDLALHEAHNALAHAQERFNALAQVAGREMPRFMLPVATVPLGAVIAAGAGVAEAKWGTKAIVANALVAAVAYGVGMMSKENADLREGAFMFARGLGYSAAGVGAHNAMTNWMAQQTAPAPVGGAMVPAAA